MKWEKKLGHEFSGINCKMVFDEHPGVIRMGSTLCLRNCAVLFVTAWAKHLIVHPDCVVGVWVCPETPIGRLT